MKIKELIVKWWLPALAALLFSAGIITILYFRRFDGTYKTLEELGGFIAGLWALAAGVLTVFAGWFVSQAERMNRRREVAATCLVELTGFWRYVATQTVANELRRSIEGLEVEKGINRIRRHGASDQILESYRRHLGSSWLLLQKTSPESFCALPIDLAHDVADYYSQMRNLIGRLNWMNDQSFRFSQIAEVIEREKNALGQLDELHSGLGEVIGYLAASAGAKSTRW